MTRRLYNDHGTTRRLRVMIRCCRRFCSLARDCFLFFFFFFSSRRRHTRCSRDWSSDVCSSDLFLDDLVWKHFFDDVRLEEPGVTQYVSKMLVDFVDVGNLYRLQNAQGKRLEDVGEMLIESNPMLEAPSLDRKSTRLNSSHGYISYAVFCLKKKKNK